MIDVERRLLRCTTYSSLVGPETHGGTSSWDGGPGRHDGSAEAVWAEFGSHVGHGGLFARRPPSVSGGLSTAGEKRGPRGPVSF